MRIDLLYVSNAWRRALGGAVLLAMASSTWAQGKGAIEIVTGEYVPFVSEVLPDGGVTAAVVRAAFKAQGVEVAYHFRPWKRGYLETGRGLYVGTFPYLRTEEREKEFLYSSPIYADQFRLFVMPGEESKRSWLKKSLCVPLGYDTTQITAFTLENQITIAQPPEITNCFKMLQHGRVDGVWASELVGAATIQSTLGPASTVKMLETTLVGGTEYFFIVSKKLPQAQAWVDRFNAGLKKIKEDGTYRTIVNRFSRH